MNTRIARLAIVPFASIVTLALGSRSADASGPVIGPPTSGGSANGGAAQGNAQAPASSGTGANGDEAPPAADGEGAAEDGKPTTPSDKPPTQADPACSPRATPV